jgi:hypothetical protein
MRGTCRRRIAFSCRSTSNSASLVTSRRSSNAGSDRRRRVTAYTVQRITKHDPGRGRTLLRDLDSRFLTAKDFKAGRRFVFLSPTGYRPSGSSAPSPLLRCFAGARGPQAAAARLGLDIGQAPEVVGFRGACPNCGCHPSSPGASGAPAAVRRGSRVSRSCLPRAQSCLKLRE